MNSIIFIATGHREHGLCNSDELLSIIERIAPEIIFEEVPPAKFAAIYEGKCGDSLETIAVKKYLQKTSVIHIPVDLDVYEETEAEFRQGVATVHHLAYFRSSVYQDLNNKHICNAERLGFPYLNSNQCSSFFERKRLLEREALEGIGDNHLSEKYNSWLNFVDSRENEMLRTIYNYSDLNKYETAILLVGAEHRKPIFDKIKRFENSTSQKIEWIFDYFHSLH